MEEISFKFFWKKRKTSCLGEGGRIEGKKKKKKKNTEGKRDGGEN